MQTEPRLLLRQQFILKKLGLNPGPLDGVWGPKSIEAMRRFEARPNLFRPALQTGGLPLSETGRKPTGFWTDRNGLFFAPCIESCLDEEAEALAALTAANEAKVAARKAVVEAPVEAPAEAAEPEQAPTPADPIKVDTKSPKQQHRENRPPSR